jgi:hypothetical protein
MKLLIVSVGQDGCPCEVRSSLCASQFQKLELCAALSAGCLIICAWGGYLNV